MSYTNTYTFERTFTVTIARYVASKVAGDLRRLRSYYGRPHEDEIEAYCGELVTMLAYGYVDSVEYGFKKNDERIVSLYYKAFSDGTLSDNRSGNVFARADITGAAWFSFISYSYAWSKLSESEKERIKSALPIKRTVGSEPCNGAGYWVTDQSYSSDGIGVQRRMFRPY